MYILTLRTDKPEAEIGLFNDQSQLVYINWPAHRALAETIHQQLRQLLEQADLTFQDINGIVAFAGPGSFTGLRIGISVANTLAYGLQIPIVGSQMDEWIKTGIQRLHAGDNSQQVTPIYGSLPHTTTPKH